MKYKHTQKTHMSLVRRTAINRQTRQDVHVTSKAYGKQVQIKHICFPQAPNTDTSLQHTTIHTWSPGG